MNSIKIFSFLILFLSTTSYSSIIDVEAKGVYGGFWRDLYKLGPVVADTVGGDLGIFASQNLKVGFSFATLVGLLSTNKDEDIFDAISTSSSKYNDVLNALEPADFSYSTAAFKLEYIFYQGTTFGWSGTTNLGIGVVGFKPGEGDSFFHNYASVGSALIIKITNNFRMSFGISYRKDLDADEENRKTDFKNFNAFTIYNHVYVAKF